MMESTYLAVEFMSAARGGRGGVVVNVSSMGGVCLTGSISTLHILPHYTVQGSFLCHMPPTTVPANTA